MDFKVTGTVDGITATQMDIKVDGLSYEILEKALNQAREGRMHILGKITECIAEPHSAAIFFYFVATGRDRELPADKSDFNARGFCGPLFKEKDADGGAQ